MNAVCVNGDWTLKPAAIINTGSITFNEGEGKKEKGEREKEREDEIKYFPY